MGDSKSCSTWFKVSLVVVVGLGLMCSRCNSLTQGTTTGTTKKIISQCDKVGKVKLEKVCITERFKDRKPTAINTKERKIQDDNDQKTLKACCAKLKSFETDLIAANCLCKTFTEAADAERLDFPLVMHLGDLNRCNITIPDSPECNEDD